MAKLLPVLASGSLTTYLESDRRTANKSNRIFIIVNSELQNLLFTMFPRTVRMSKLSPSLPLSGNEQHMESRYASTVDVENSPCPHRPASSSSFSATPSSFLSTVPSIPAGEINLEASLTCSEIASFPHQIFKHSLRFATPPKTKSSRKAWWWKKGLRLKEKGASERLR